MASIRTLLVQRKLALVIILSVVIRLAVVLLFPSVFAFDQTGKIHGSDAYDTYARNLLASGIYGRTYEQQSLGDWVAAGNILGENVYRLPAVVPDALIPPLYSYFLAAVYGAIGRGYLQVALFHILLDALSIAMLYEIARRLMPHGEWVGSLAALFYAVYPYLIFQNLTLIDTPLFMTLLHAFVLLMVLLRQRPSLDKKTWSLAVLGGVTLGLGMLVRPILPPLALLVGLWFLFRLNFWQTLVRLLPVAVFGVLAIVPWIARNYAEFDAFIPMTTTSGANFWQGSSPYTVPYFRAGYDVQWTSPETLEAVDDNSLEADAERLALALQYLRENPGKIPELLWVKFLVHWSIDIAPRFNPVEGQLPPLDYQGNVASSVDSQGNLSLDGLPENDPVSDYSEPLFDQLGRVIHRYYFGGLFFLALAGVVVSFRYWREVSLLWFVQVSMTVMYVLFHPSTRYRVPSDPLLFVFSAYTLVWLWNWYWARRKSPASSVLYPSSSHTL